MEFEHNIEELLVKHLLGESDEAEELLIRNWLDASGENRMQLDALKKTVEVLALQKGIDKINIDEEWAHLQDSIAEGAAGRMVIPAVTANAPVYDEEEKVPVKYWRPGKVYRLIIAAAIAAAVIVAVVNTGWLRNGYSDAPASLKDSESVARINPANAVMHHEINSSGKIKVFALPDGSQVRLSANSELMYSEPSGEQQRNVQLKGEAAFAVAKDKTKPFTVFSGDISTRAVGTKFTVTAFENEKFIRVKLEEGKVLVKSERKINNTLTGDFYLLPGQQLLYDKNQQTAKIRSFGGEDKKLADRNNNEEKLTNDNPLLPGYNKKSWFMFNNQSLADIFHSLEMMYDVRIVYVKKDVEQHYFIGTFSKSDSVEGILQQIAVLNKLTVTKKDNSFIINKKK